MTETPMRETATRAAGDRRPSFAGRVADPLVGRPPILLDWSMSEREARVRLEAAEDAVAALTREVQSLADQVAELTRSRIPEPALEVEEDGDPWRLRKADQLQPGDRVLLDAVVRMRAIDRPDGAPALVHMMIETVDGAPMREISLPADDLVPTMSGDTPTNTKDPKS